MDPGAQIRARRAAFRRQTAPRKRGKDPFRGMPRRSLEPGIDLLRPVQGVKFLASDASGFACAWVAIPHRVKLKELEEWFDTQKEMQAIAKLDPYFQRTSKLASRRLKREIERRGTIGEFALKPDLSLKEDPHRGKRL
jgi:hypothetical protein